MAYNSSSGEVSFASMTDQPQNLQKGDNITIDLSDTLTTWNTLNVDSVGGEITAGEELIVYVEFIHNLDRIKQFMDDPFDGAMGDFFYDDSSFTTVEDAESDTAIYPVPGHQPSLGNPRAVIELNESLLDSLFVKWQYPVHPRWGNGPQSITVPYRGDPAINVYETNTAGVGVIFRD